jgi:hypothetical protein
MRQESYIGDGVYVEFTGYSVILRANDPKFPSDTIHLEQNELSSLVRFARENGFTIPED